MDSKRPRTSPSLLDLLFNYSPDLSSLAVNPRKIKELQAVFARSNLLALSGPTGCGKSSLLKAIAKAENFSTVEAEINSDSEYPEFKSLFERFLGGCLEIDGESEKRILTLRISEEFSDFSSLKGFFLDYSERINETRKVCVIAADRALIRLGVEIATVKLQALAPSFVKRFLEKNFLSSELTERAIREGKGDLRRVLNILWLEAPQGTVAQVPRTLTEKAAQLLFTTRKADEIDMSQDIVPILFENYLKFSQNLYLSEYFSESDQDGHVLPYAFNIEKFSALNDQAIDSNSKIYENLKMFNNNRDQLNEFFGDYCRKFHSDHLLWNLVEKLEYMRMLKVLEGKFS